MGKGVPRRRDKNGGRILGLPQTQDARQKALQERQQALKLPTVDELVRKPLDTEGN